jgi:hypothetical protein
MINALLEQGTDTVIGSLPGGGGLSAGDAVDILKKIESGIKYNLGFRVWIEVEYTACLPCSSFWGWWHGCQQYENQTNRAYMLCSVQQTRAIA